MKHEWRSNADPSPTQLVQNGGASGKEMTQELRLPQAMEPNSLHYVHMVISGKCAHKVYNSTWKQYIAWSIKKTLMY